MLNIFKFYVKSDKIERRKSVFWSETLVILTGLFETAAAKQRKLIGNPKHKQQALSGRLIRFIHKQTKTP